MPRALALSLHLLTRRGRPPQSGLLAGPVAARPPGQLICICIASPEAETAAAQLSRALLRRQPGVALLVVGAAVGGGFPAAAVLAPTPDDTTVSANAFLAHWQPALCLFAGTDQLPERFVALIAEAGKRGIALVLAEGRLVVPGGALGLRRFWHRAILRALLAGFARIFTPDQASATALGRLGIAPERVQVTGNIREPVEPLPCTEAERAVLARQLRSRPVWFAVSVPEAEEAAVLDAHEMVLMRAHRMLLILLPENPARAPLLAAEVEARGHRAARRTAEEEPEDDVQVLVVEDLSELGLWYRLAPVTWMGGTLSPGTDARSPLEAAALGSAIVHGPAGGAHAAEYARLGEAGACRVATSARGLAEVLSELIAPDRVAALAHNAWVLVSGDAGVADEVARQVLATLDAAPPRSGAAR